MKRLAFSLLGLALLAAPLTAEGQPAGTLGRIGVLDVGSAADASARIESFRKGLRELGHVEGQNIRIEWRFADGQSAKLPHFASELVGLKPDVLVSSHRAGAFALRTATMAIPVVVAGADVGTQFISPQNLARPLGNVTGVTLRRARVKANGWSCCEKRFQPYHAWQPSTTPPFLVPARAGCRSGSPSGGN